MMTRKKTPAPTVAEPQQQVSDQGGFPHPIAPPFRAGWEHALTKKYGPRGKAWTSTKSEPQWTLHFQDHDAATWFRDTWTS
jgi:hypothetical protein